ncbi:MAG TPA: hypothetical protein VKU85_18550, partial [bacterium]|nr:hypothetical protein [bacterium]
GSVKIGSLDGGEPRVLFDAESAAVPASGHLLYLAANTLLARPYDEATGEPTGGAFPVAERVESIFAAGTGVFSASDNGVLVYQVDTPDVAMSLVWMDREGNETGTLGEPSMYDNPDFSPDGEYLALEDWSSGESADLWIYEISRGIRTRFTLGTASEVEPKWTPDGRFIIYTSDESGAFDLYRKSVVGSEEAELLLATEVDKTPYHVSPDGRLLAFGQEQDVWVLPLDGSGEAYPFLDGEYSEWGAQFSPDGRWMAYNSNESGQVEAYVAPFPGPGRKYQLSTEGGAGPEWRDDGKEILYGHEDGLFSVTVESGANALRIGPPVRLLELTGVVGGAIFPGAQRFLAIKSEREPEVAPLALVVNWTAELEGR